MVFINKTNKWLHARKLFHVVSYFYMWYQSYKTVVPQVILNFKWSSMIKVPSSTRAQVYQMDDPCYDIGEVSHKLVSRSKILFVVSQGLQVVSFQQSSDVHKKMQDSIFNHLPQMQTFASMRSTPFMEIDDKGGEIVQRYESFGRDWDKEVEVGHGRGQRGSNIEEWRRIKIIRQEKHTSRGSKLMNFDWLHLICAYSCACLHCISS